MTATQSPQRIRSSHRKCKHCGHRVYDPISTVCEGCRVPHGRADQAVGSIMKWTAVILCALIFLILWPQIYKVLMEIVD